MDSAIAAAASLLGVAMGVWLTTFGARRAEIRRLFREARVAVNYLRAAGLVYTSYSVDSVRHDELSDQMLRMMATEKQRAMVDARRALSALSAFSVGLQPFAVDIAALGENDARVAECLFLIDQEESRALRSPFRRGQRSIQP